MNTTARRGRRSRGRIGRTLGIGFTVIGTAVLGACERPSTAPSGEMRVAYGPETALGGGTARTYLQTANGAPVELGIAFSEGALNQLPGHDTPGGVHLPDGHHMFEYVLALPEENPTPFRHVLLDWNPGGHEPPGVYDLPHFDMHFYLLTVAERRAIDPADAAFGAKATHFPAAGQMPAGYTAIPGAVPFMGAHWVDPTSPELHGEAFTQTFIYGSWDGEMIFAEPMITREFLASKPQFEEALKVPEQFAEPGYYPAKYSIRWDEAAREYRVALGGFTLR